MPISFQNHQLLLRLHKKKITFNNSRVVLVDQFLMKNIVGILVFAFVTVIGTQDTMALPQFKKAFAEKYAAKHKSKEFQTAAKKASCNVCHVKGPKKTVQNDL